MDIEYKCNRNNIRYQTGMHLKKDKHDINNTTNCIGELEIVKIKIILF